jgi:hypothetical protein
VEGDNTGGGGVFGQSSSGTGIQGVSTTGVGIFGSGKTIGVFGGTDTGFAAVDGASTSGYGVYGTNVSPAGGKAAVQGFNTGGGSGVVGFSSGPGSTGVGGGSDTGTGFYGVASSTGTGVVATSVSGTAFYAVAQTTGQFAGVLKGKVQVQGDFTVVGGVKSAAVRGADGSLRRLYCLEGPESWFEDFGSGQLSNGFATVQLEPGFAGVVKTDTYHVFLTPQGESKGWLYVSGKSPAGFTVHEAGGGASNIAFDYRIVAKRRDIAGARLEPVEKTLNIELPKLPEPPSTSPGHGH